MPERATSPGLQMALRTLLENPLLLEDMEGFREVWAWRAEVRAWFERYAGWMVQMGPGVLRLLAPSPHSDGGRALGELASSRGVALLAWVLWFHEYLGLRLGEPKQFSLSEMAERISAQSGLNFSEILNRRALVQAVRCAHRIGLLNILDDESSRWEGGETTGGALLEFTVGAAYLISRPKALPQSPVQRAVQALLVGPALVQAHDPAAFAALERNEAFVQEALQDALGWPLDLQPHYACLLRGGQTGLYPGRSVADAVALLLVEAVRTEVQEGRLEADAQGHVRLSSTRLYGLLDRVREQHRQHWGEKGKQSSERLLREVEVVWQEWGAVELEGELWVLKPHLARFTAQYYDPEKPLLEHKIRRTRRR